MQSTGVLTNIQKEYLCLHRKIQFQTADPGNLLAMITSAKTNSFSKSRNEDAAEGMEYLIQYLTEGLQMSRISSKYSLVLLKNTLPVLYVQSQNV